jgi:benzoylformate decarboxylase
VHVDLDTTAIAKNFPVDLGLPADPRLTLTALTDALERRLTPEAREQAARRVREFGDAKARDLAAQTERDLAGAERQPLSMAVFAHELARQMPEDAIVFDEALTNSPALKRHVRPNQPGGWHETRGGSLGVGIPGALGAKLAHPDRTVVAFTGDGGSMYTPQALWTAARHGIGALFVICNNGRYRILDHNIEQYWRTQGIDHHDFPDLFDLSRPAIDFAALSRSLGVPALRLEKYADLEAGIAEALAHPGPFLIDLVIGRES